MTREEFEWMLRDATGIVPMVLAVYDTLQGEVARLRDILRYIGDCEPDGRKYLDEAKALATDYGKEQAQEREHLRQELARANVRIAALEEINRIAALALSEALDAKRS